MSNISFNDAADDIHLTLNRKMYTKDDGTIVKTGDTIKSPDLASTLRKIAQCGPRVFYTGSVADDMVEDIKEAGKQ